MAARRPTMSDVATAAGVSVMTVSYAYSQPDRVSEQAATRVKRAAERLGYPGPHPGARSLRRGRAGSLGVALGERLVYAFDDPQAARFLAGVADVCAEEGVGLTLVPLTGADDDPVRIGAASVDAFVVWTTADDDPMLDAVIATGLPAVVHGGPDRPDVPTVSIDNRSAAAAIGLTAFAGARVPAILSFPLNRDRRSALLRGPAPELATYPVTRTRLEGLRDACRELGLDWRAVPVAVCASNSRALAEAQVADLLRETRIDAIAAMSDELALGALRATAAAGLAVPDAVAITGWDDSEYAEQARLTTVAQSLRAQGAHCAHIALGHQINHSHADPASWSIVRRETTRLMFARAAGRSPSTGGPERGSAR